MQLLFEEFSQLQEMGVGKIENWGRAGTLACSAIENQSDCEAFDSPQTVSVHSDPLHPDSKVVKINQTFAIKKNSTGSSAHDDDVHSCQWVDNKCSNIPKAFFAAHPMNKGEIIKRIMEFYNIEADGAKVLFFDDSIGNIDSVNDVFNGDDVEAAYKNSHVYAQLIERITARSNTESPRGCGIKTSELDAAFAAFADESDCL